MGVEKSPKIMASAESTALHHLSSEAMRGLEKIAKLGFGKANVNPCNITP